MVASVGVVLAAAELVVEKLARHAGGNDLAGVLVFKADQTAQTTPVAQALPFLDGHLF
jgi:hypothetical protein